MRPGRARIAAMVRLSTLAVILGVTTAGCLGGAGCDLPTRVELTLSPDGLEPADPAVCRDQTVTLVVASEVDGVIHIHGYDERVPATTVRAGEVPELEFPSPRSGQFPLELQAAEDSAGRSVGIFTVHEP